MPYTSQRRRQPAPSSFTRGLSALRESMPDPTVVKTGALSAMAAAKEKTSKLSTTLYREVKGLTSSELEQVMLKATRPDDTPVKGKHVERLVGVTYQINGRYDIYDAVLRKLWNKMAEPDWRTKVKALYVLHRFSSDGAPDHQASLKARLRELRRTRDPKRKEKYFNGKQFDKDNNNDNTTTKATKHYKAFLERYARYVFLRAQCFGGMFGEISNTDNDAPTANGSRSAKKDTNNNTTVKPITSTNLRADHLEAATLLLKAGCACLLRDGESCEHTAAAMERVAADMIGLTAAVATALNRALKNNNSNNNMDAALLQRWCVFYKDDLLPKTKLLVKKASVKLDKYGLFLPTRMGASVRPELLERGLSYNLEEEEEEVVQVKEEEDADGGGKAVGSAVQEEAAEKEAADADSISRSKKVSGTKKVEVEEEEVDDDDDDESEEEEEDSPEAQPEENVYDDEEYDYEEVEEYYDEE